VRHIFKFGAIWTRVASAVRMALISGAPALMSREIEASDWSELAKLTTTIQIYLIYTIYILITPSLGHL
jgi:hypothetical protein